MSPIAQKRSRQVLLIFIIGWLALILRLIYLQGIQGGSLSQSASMQRVKQYQIENLRGDVLDRNSIPFTGRNERFTIVLKPIVLRENIKELQNLCALLGQDYQKVKSTIETQKEPLLFETDQKTKDAIITKGIVGVSAINSMKRYDETSIARHVIGYLNRVDQIGETGIEKYFDDALHYDLQTSLGIVTDAKDNPVQGMGYRLVQTGSAEKRLSIQLTLDYHLQKLVEDVMKKNNLTGAVIIEDVYTGELLAIASKPDYDQNAVEKFLESSEKELFNRATAAYNLGSIFKIVDAALLLEMGEFQEESIFCPGYFKIGNREFKCSSYQQGGHGWMNLRQAFTHSCNTFFIEMGIRLGYSRLMEMAKRFGLGSKTGIEHQGVLESGGNLPDLHSYYSEGDIANLSIGQGEILATPLQVVDMIATVANGGIKNKINIVDAVVDEDGNKVRTVKIQEGKRILSKETADTIKAFMEEVTLTGTGKKAGLMQYGGAAGKTGSAQTGQNGVVHAWFAGYFPQKSPRYAMTVFIENGQYGGTAAAPIFAEIAEEIMRKGF